MHDTEDKKWWVIEWAKKEQVFVEQVCPELGIKGEINPEKLRGNRFAIDLVVDGRLSDLKCQETPFFTSRRYGIDPQFTITFNRKDYTRYSNLYPSAMIYFWVDWKKLEMTIRGQLYSVLYMAGIWRVPFQVLKQRIEDGGVPLHPYQRRQGDIQGNALDSFLFDLRTFERMKQVGPLENEK